jgi:hypothetical protein
MIEKRLLPELRVKDTNKNPNHSLLVCVLLPIGAAAADKADEPENLPRRCEVVVAGQPTGVAGAGRSVDG